MAANLLTTPRSALFVPADRVDRFDSAFSCGADAVIVDLEDAVLPDGKDGARAALTANLPGRSGPAQVLLRVNSPLLPAGRADLEAAPGLGADAIMVPKAELETLDLAAAAGLPLVALVETAAGILHAEAIAAHPAVAFVMLGPVDLAAELAIAETPDGDGLGFARGMLVLAAAAAGKPGPLDGPCLTPRDEAPLRLELERAKRLGFAGKSCIHPAQIGPVNAAFSPSAEEAEWAGRVLEAFEAADGGVTVLDGQMVDRPVVLRARQVLSNHRRSSER